MAESCFARTTPRLRFLSWVYLVLGAYLTYTSFQFEVSGQSTPQHRMAVLSGVFALGLLFVMNKLRWRPLPPGEAIGERGKLTIGAVLRPAWKPANGYSLSIAYRATFSPIRPYSAHPNLANCLGKTHIRA